MSHIPERLDVVLKLECLQVCRLPDAFLVCTLGCRVGVEKLVKDVVVHLHLYAKDIDFVCSHFSHVLDRVNIMEPREVHGLQGKNGLQGKKLYNNIAKKDVHYVLTSI